MATKPKSVPVFGPLRYLKFDCPQRLANGTICGQDAPIQKQILTFPQTYHCLCPAGHKFHRALIPEPRLTSAEASRPCDCDEK